MRIQIAVSCPVSSETGVFFCSLPAKAEIDRDGMKREVLLVKQIRESHVIPPVPAGGLPSPLTSLL